MVQWFKRHPEFLRRESQVLSNNSNYKELFQMRDNIFISHGEIIVRLNETHKFPILLVYHDSTPYSLPDVFPLKQTMEENDLKEIAKLRSYEVFKKISSEIKFYYNLRHQNGSGNLCILESDNLDDGSKFYGISSVLKRVRDWYAGHITGSFPIDSQEIELFSHFINVNTDLSLIYSEQFLDSRIIEGDAYLVLTHQIPKTQYLAKEKLIYSGLHLDGITKSGLILNVEADIKCSLNERLKKVSDLHKYPEIVNRLVEEKSLLKASWFNVDVEPQPFQTFKELIKIIGNGEYAKGVTRLKNRSASYFSNDPDNFFIGIRYANRHEIFEFILFKIYKKASPPVIRFEPEHKIESMLDRYEKVEAIECEKVTEESFHQRNSARAAHSILKNKVVNILGVGAIGSEIADCLAKAGVGGLLLVDNQNLKAHNAVRHLAGMEHIGQLKVNAVSSIIKSHNPFIKVYNAPFNLSHLSPNNNLTIDSISISSVAEDNLEGYINEQFVIANRISFYVRALRGGKTGRIFRVIPGHDACFQCLNLYRKDKNIFVDVPEDLEYPTLKNECNNPIRPASAADLKLIASLASRLLLDFLQNKMDDSNHWIWSSEEVAGTAINTPYTVHKQKIPIHPKCLYCNHEKLLKVFIKKDNVDFMQRLINADPKVETGGVLAGTRDEEGNFLITNVSDAGPKAIKDSAKFEKDIEHCQTFLDELYVNSKQKTVYLGEWHSHPSADNRPSGQDIESMTSIAVQKEYLTTEPISIIFSNTGKPSCTVHPSGKRYYFTELIIT